MSLLFFNKTATYRHTYILPSTMLFVVFFCYLVGLFWCNVQHHPATEICSFMYFICIVHTLYTYIHTHSIYVIFMYIYSFNNLWWKYLLLYLVNKCLYIAGITFVALLTIRSTTMYTTLHTHAFQMAQHFCIVVCSSNYYSLLKNISFLENTYTTKK